MYKKHTYKNGLRLITVPSKNTKTVALLLLVGTGSKYETKEINGISHFLEHMFFKGTKKRPDTLKLIEPLDKVGGEYNAFTSQDFTGYWAKVDASHLDVVLDWVSDIYLNSKIEQAEINRERGTILQELNMYLDMPQRYVQDLWLELLYGDQPAGWKVIGTEKVISSLKRDQFLKYLKSHYSAKNTVLAVAGQINPKSIQEKVAGYFKDLEARELPHKKEVEEKQSSPGLLLHYKKTDQAHINLGVRAYNSFHPDKHALGLLATILGGNMSSRLFISVRERQGLAYYVATESDTDPDAGFLMTRAGLDKNKTERGIETILKEYRKIAEEGVSRQELRKAKDYTRGRALLGMEASDEKASFYAFQELLKNEILTLDEKLAKIEAVTRADIKRVARDIFKPEKLNLAMIGPFKDKKTFEKLLKL